MFAGSLLQRIQDFVCFGDVRNMQAKRGGIDGKRHRCGQGRGGFMGGRHFVKQCFWLGKGKNDGQIMTFGSFSLVGAVN